MNTISKSGSQPTSNITSQQPRASFWRAETIGQKLTLGFLVILVLLAVSGVVAYIELARVGKNTTVMEDASMRAMSAAHLQRLAETSLLPVHDYILTGDPAAKAQFDKLSSEVDATVTELAGKPISRVTTSMSMSNDSTPAATSGMSMGGDSTATTTSGMSMGGNSTPTATSGMSMSSDTTSMTSTGLPSDQMVLLNSFNDKWMSVHDAAEKIFAISNPVANPDAVSQLKDMEASAESMSAYAESIHEVQMGNVSQSRTDRKSVV